MSIESASKAFGELVKNVGFPVVVAGFVLWHNYNMNASLQAELAAVRDYQRDTMASIIQANTAAMDRMTRVCDRLEAKQ
jgi:hypothetical protein